MSVRQGGRVTDLLSSRALPRNRAFGGVAVAVPPAGPLPVIELVDGLRITVLAPEEEGLFQLSNHWDVELAKIDHGERPSTGTQDQDVPDDGASDDEYDDATDGTPTPQVVIFCAREDEEWADRLVEHLSTADVAALTATTIEVGDEWRKNVEQMVGSNAAALVLVSDRFLASEFARTQLGDLVKDLRSRQIRLTWVLLNSSSWQETPLAEIQSVHDLSEPLATLDDERQEQALASIAEDLTVLVRTIPTPSRSAPRRPVDPTSVDVDALANSQFRHDRSVPNRSSMAFLVEFEGRSTVVGGDAPDDTLIRSLRRLLDERDLERMRVDAFVIPHNGSRNNVSRELLDLLHADRYLISSNGAYFRNPHAETVARLIQFGRAGKDDRPTLVFNYRSEFNEMWDDPDLQARYGYDAVYPDEGGAGIRIDLL